MNTKWLSEISYEDISLVGGKNCSLGEMIQNLTSENINIPNGYAITTTAYDSFLNYNNLTEWIENIIKNFPENIIEQRRIGMEVRSKISNGIMPSELEVEILEMYQKLSDRRHNS